MTAVQGWSLYNLDPYLPQDYDHESSEDYEASAGSWVSLAHHTPHWIPVTPFQKQPPIIRFP